jgi:hypothetical protein
VPGTSAPDGSVPGDAVPGITVRAWTDPVSGEYWTQRNLTVAVTKQLTTFTATIRIGMGAGEKYAGAFTTLPSEDMTFTSRTEGGMILYRWTLRPGRTIRAGSYQLGAQFSHSPGDRATADTYAVGDATGSF